MRPQDDQRPPSSAIDEISFLQDIDTVFEQIKGDAA
jgi:hypothetical protein